jgi:hypothetical protein
MGLLVFVLLNSPVLDQGAAQARRWPDALGLLAGFARHRPARRLAIPDG